MGGMRGISVYRFNLFCIRVAVSVLNFSVDLLCFCKLHLCLLISVLSMKMPHFFFVNYFDFFKL